MRSALCDMAAGTRHLPQEEAEMTEKDLQKALAKALEARWMGTRLPVPYVHEPVENMLNVGTFDNWICVGGVPAWVELKVCGPNAKPDMRPGQPGFGYRMLKAGVRAVVLCGSGDGSWKLLRGDTVGSDWREKLIARGDVVDEDVVHAILSMVPRA